MPFGKLNYNGDLIVLNDVMHDQHFRCACQLTAYCQPFNNVVLAWDSDKLPMMSVWIFGKGIIKIKWS